MKDTNTNPAIIFPTSHRDQLRTLGKLAHKPLLSTRRNWFADEDDDIEEPDEDEEIDESEEKSDGDGEPSDEELEWVNRRVSRAKKKSKADLAKEFGFNNVTEMRKFFEKQKDKTSPVADPTPPSPEPEEDPDEIPPNNVALERLEALSQKLKNGALRSWLSKQEGLNDPAVVSDVVDRLNTVHAEDLGDVVGEEGITNPAELTKLLNQIRKDRPRWFQAIPPGSPSNLDGKNNNQPDSKALQESAKRMGKLVKNTF